MRETMTPQGTLKTLNKYLSAKNESYLDEGLAKLVPKSSIPKYRSIAKLISYPLQLNDHTMYLRKPSYLCH